MGCRLACSLTTRLWCALQMTKYDEVANKLEKKFDFVRGAQIFWQQDSVIDSELPPPFNLIQFLHPKREIVACKRAYFLGLSRFPSR